MKKFMQKDLSKASSVVNELPGEALLFCLTRLQKLKGLPWSHARKT
jgi:hypothetical protein